MTGPRDRDGVEATGHDVAADADRFRALHVPGDPLLLANVWDPATARVVEAAGLRAIATASAAVAPVNGFEDHGKLPPDVAFEALGRIVEAVRLPVTADLEDGYGLQPEDLVQRLAAAGACGFNVEDTDHGTGSLVEAGRHAERIAALREAGRARGFKVVVNARVDVHLHHRSLEEGLERAREYFDAGADCVYPVALSDLAAIREYVALGPTNVLYGPESPPLRELAAVGVSRISVGPFFFRLLLKRLNAAAEALRRFDDAAIWA